jgi:hypothetical protein
VLSYITSFNALLYIISFNVLVYNIKCVLCVECVLFTSFNVLVYITSFVSDQLLMWCYILYHLMCLGFRV